jgi:NTP pyrophosphatase (non-canonical NTP hydrolase)
MSEDLLKAYKSFVDGVTSEASKNNDVLIQRLKELDEQGCQIARLDTAGDGLAGEGGEVKDLIKKIKFHGKPWNEENKNKLISEAGDIAWYWMNLCIALDLDPTEVILNNIKKLESRYPGGTFSVDRSENRTNDKNEEFDVEIDPVTFERTQVKKS